MTRFGIKQFSLIVVAMLMCAGCSGTDNTKDSPVNVSTAETAQESASDDTSATSLIGDIPTTQAFLDEAVEEGDLNRILMAGINSPSAMNKQPWHFSVVTNKDVMQQIADGMGKGMPPMPGPDSPDKASKKAPGPDGPGADMPAPPPGAAGVKAGITDAPVAIVLSCSEGSEFDVGLACESMADMANVMGYGTKIISSPTIALNGDEQDKYKEILDIPDDMSAVAVLLVGKQKDSVDSVTSATERNPFDQVISMIH